jgi:nitric oxide reductase subunit B
VFGLTVLISLAPRTYRGGPPIPDRVVSATGMALFTVTVWRHGVYLGPDFSASYLHAVVDDARDQLAAQQGRS